MDILFVSQLLDCLLVELLEKVISGFSASFWKGLALEEEVRVQFLWGGLDISEIFLMLENCSSDDTW